MLNNLPDNYDKTQLSGNFAMVYGTGYELETVKQTLLQAEANNYLLSPDTQTGNFKVSGVGKYLIEFNIPFVTPPLNVSIVGSDFTDVFIEYSSRFGMIVNVQTDAQDVLKYRASGFVGAASDEYLGDALYNNFGALYQFPRQGDSQINNTYVNFYQQVDTFVKIQNIIPAQVLSTSVIYDVNGNPIPPYPISLNTSPPIDVSYLKGLIRPTSVVSSPTATHELVDLSGNLIALLDASTANTTLTSPVSSFYQTSGDNFYKTDPEVYVVGFFTTFEFNAWEQPSYIQEVFRADNKYRRILAGINKSLILGPTIPGVSNMIEALIAQPFIPHEMWDDSDYRLFLNQPGLSYSKYNIGKANSQYEGYPAAAPTVEVRRIIQPWTPENITYNTKPQTISIEVPVTQTVNVLNNATRFDVTNELTRLLRLGIDMPQGGIINWNYQDAYNSIPVTGSELYEQYNYVFLNNSGDSIVNINIFWYAQQVNVNGPFGYRTFGPLQFGRDYFLIPTINFLNNDGSYSLPSELLIGYNCNSNIPYLSQLPDTYGNTSWLGNDLTNSGQLPTNTPSLPQFLIQLDLRNISIYNYNNTATKMPTNPYDFILYSYGQVNLTQAEAIGSFIDTTDLSQTHTIAAYYDADTNNAFQPVDSPFATSNNSLSPLALAQNSFAKLVTTTGYEYITTMIGGQITFNKTIYAENLKIQSALNNSSISSPGILVIKAFKVVNGNFPNLVGQIGTNQYTLSGKLDRIISSNNGNRYFQIDLGNYVLLDANNNPIAIFNSSSPVNFDTLLGQEITVTGVVFYTIWDTRIPVSYYRAGSPVFQSSTNFSGIVNTYTPDINVAFNNQNFLIILNGLPLGNQQTLTASWTFNIVPTFGTSNTNSNANALPFSDTSINSQTTNEILPGIMSQFTGLTLLQNELDPDNSTYEQVYQSPAFSGYFLNYNDYINVIGSKISPFGDTNALNTLTNPILSSPVVGEPQLNTVLNFFSPNYGFISLSVLPNMEFYTSGTGNAINVIRPNNNGVALQIVGDSYAGLTFYGSNQDKIVDKPTRLSVDFVYATTQTMIRKKIIEIEDGGYANWVDAKYPDIVQNNSTFFIAGNQFKYPHEGYDQATNQYSNNLLQNSYTNGQYYDLFPTNQNQPVFFTDPSQNALLTAPSALGEYGPPQRYRRTKIDNNSSSSYETSSSFAITKGYLNTSPEKISYIQFDLSDFPIDSIINNAILEIYFASGFTIKQGKDTNFELNKNKAWQKSKLSGNGKTFVKTLTDPVSGEYTVNQPLNNAHWRKNFFEVIIPYAFISEPNDLSYGIRNLFSNGNSNTLPAPQNPQPNLEYLGFLNIDEINTATLTATNFIENSVGLSNIILSTSSIIYQINGILSFGLDSSNNTTILNPFDKVNGLIYSLDGTQLIGQFINQINVLPNMKTLTFPFGLSSDLFFYGYVKSLLPASLIGFTSSDIAIYQQALNFVQPLYANYTVKLLEADTYFPFVSFQNYAQYDNTINDIAY